MMTKKEYIQKFFHDYIIFDEETEKSIKKCKKHLVNGNEKLYSPFLKRCINNKKYVETDCMWFKKIIPYKLLNNITMQLIANGYSIYAIYPKGTDYHYCGIQYYRESIK